MLCISAAVRQQQPGMISPTCVYADMLEGRLEVRDVGLQLPAEDLAHDEVGDEDELLRDGEHQRPQRGHVDLRRPGGSRSVTEDRV